MVANRFFRQLLIVSRFYHAPVLQKQVFREQSVVHIYRRDPVNLDRPELFRLGFSLELFHRGAVTPHEKQNPAAVNLVMGHNLRHFHASALAVGAERGNHRDNVIAVVNVHILHNRIRHHSIESGFVIIKIVGPRKQIIDIVCGEQRPLNW